MTRRTILLPSLCALAAVLATVAARPALRADAPPAPVTRRAPVTDTYHGTAVADDYRWLEDAKSPEVVAWTEAQNRRTRAFLDALPGVERLRARVREIRSIQVPRFSSLRGAGGRLFALRFQPPQQQPVVVVLPSADEPAAARVVLDLNRLDPSGATSLDWYVPSPDGRRVAVSLARGGSERGDVHVYDVDSGQALPDVVEHVNGGTAGGSLAWDARGEGFFYTRYPRPGERPAADLDFYVQVYHHRLGTPDSSDRYELGRDFVRIAEIELRTPPDGRYLLANVQNGDGGEFEQYLRREDGSWTRLSRFEDRTLEAVFDEGDGLLLLSRAGASRGRLLRLALSPTGSLAAPAPLVPEGDGVIVPSFSWGGSSNVVPFGDRLYVVEQTGGPNRVRVLDRATGRELATLPLPEASAVHQLVPEPGTGALLLQVASYVEPTTWYRFRPAEPTRLARTALTFDFPISLRDAQVARVWAVSKDGTRVPMTVISPKDAKRDGTRPALLTGYGGYGISLSPGFDPGLRLWLDRGGVLAVANLRGGGEFGAAWHDEGRLLHKQNVFDDFLACAETLVREGYASPRRLAIEGGSNGGLLMGAALTQRPELFAAVVSHVGIYDMLRVELSPNGAFNVPEYGSVKDEAQFRALFAYSPYHHVKDGVAYPPVLMPTGANDPRVDPMHSRKMVARLQAATGDRGIVLLRASSRSGHGIGTPLDERIALESDVLAFLFSRLGMEEPAR